MPTYEYKCDACGHAFEQFQSITAGPIRKCPKCGKLKVRRLISTGAGLIFKGSGFYETDYRSESYKKGAKADAPATTTSSTESKPADTKPSATETAAPAKTPAPAETPKPKAKAAKEKE
jgi:putative FmdB family regulatory protein